MGKKTLATPEDKARVASSTAKKLGSIPKGSLASKLQKASDRREASKTSKPH